MWRYANGPLRSNWRPLRPRALGHDVRICCSVRDGAAKISAAVRIVARIEAVLALPGSAVRDRIGGAVRRNPV